MGMTPEYIANLKKKADAFKNRSDYAKLTSKSGSFYDFDVDLISPDPNQPRKNFDEDALQELADDLKKNGLIQPIVVRDDPDNVGKFIVVAGERRLKAAKLAGFKKIRSILSTYDNSQLGYVQIAENAKRDNLKFYEMAEFIVSRSDAGEKQADIAEKLGLSKTKLSEFMIWKDAPEFLKKAKEKFNAIRAFYDAVKLNEEHPDELSEFIEKNETISKTDISNFRKKILEKENQITEGNSVSEDDKNQMLADFFGSRVEGDATDEEDSTSLENDSTEDSFEEPANASDYESDDTEEESSEATTDDFSSDDSAESAEISNSAPTFQDEAFSGVDTSINESESESLADTDFDSETKSKKLKHPVFVGTVDGREAEIVLEMPTTDGMVKVKYEDGSLDEVLCENFILNRIYES